MLCLAAAACSSPAAGTSDEHQGLSSRSTGRQTSSKHRTLAASAENSGIQLKKTWSENSVGGDVQGASKNEFC